MPAHPFLKPLFNHICSLHHALFPNHDSRAAERASLSVPVFELLFNRQSSIVNLQFDSPISRAFVTVSGNCGEMLEKGLIQVYTSQCDDVNFAPFGLTLRACGHGLRTLVVSFNHPELLEGFQMACSLFRPRLTVEFAVGEEQESDTNGGNGEAFRISQAYERARKATFSRHFDIVILSGIHGPLSQGLIPIEEVLSLMAEKPQNVELVLSGPGARGEVLERADYVTEMVVRPADPPPRRPGWPERSGKIEVITGNGKGKTTYCLGKGMLTSCVGVPTLIFQFMKSPRPYGEVRASQVLPFLEIKTMGKGFLSKHSPHLYLKHWSAAQEAWRLWLQLIRSKRYGLIALDEINVATHHGLISGLHVREQLFFQPHEFDILLSGRDAHTEVLEVAASVIEMKEIKHPFRKGITARKGIEF